jgi:hypothetical protein
MSFGKKRDIGYVWNLACLVIGYNLVEHGRKDMCTKDRVGWTTSVSTLSLSPSGDLILLVSNPNGGP